MEERTESDKYKQWDGCVEGNYLPEPLACCQHEDIHLFCTESDSWARREGKRERERERTRQERGRADHRLRTRGSEWELERGREATTSESFKPVIAVGDAKQDWGFLQHVEEKQIPLHGLLQRETDLVSASEGGHFLSRSYLGRVEI